MKSVVQEASSVAKAIEQAWHHAGKPAEFSIKILQMPERNFFGLTTKSAKIAFVFDQQKVQSETQRTQARPPAHRPARSEPPMRQQRPPARHDGDRRPSGGQGYDQRPPRQDRHDRHDRQERPDRRQQRPEQGRRPYQPRPEGEQRERTEYAPRPDAVWQPEMVTAAREWVLETLTLMGISNINVDTHVSRHYLNIILDAPVETDERQQELLFRSWSNLLMDALRDRFDKNISGLRISLQVRN